MNISPLLRFGFCFTTMALACCGTAALAQDAAVATPDLKQWSVKVYRYPSEALNRGFATRDRGQLRAPVMPAADAKEEEAIAFIRRSTDIVGTYLKEQGANVPEGTLFAYDRASQTLAVRTTGEAHGMIGKLAQDAQKGVGQYLIFSVQIMEAEADAVRAGVKEAATTADHTAMYSQLDALVKQGRGRRLTTLRLETRSGQRATVTSAQERQYPTEFTADEQGRLEIAQEMRPVGPSMEIDPVIGPDGVTVDLNYAIEYHFAPPTARWEPTALTGPRRLETRALDFHTVSLNSAATMLSGTTKLLGTWAPEGAQGAEAPKQLQAAFLKAHVVSLLPPQDNRPEQLIAAFGENAQSTPKAQATEAESRPAALPAGMEVRRYRVPLNFLTRDPAAYGGAAAAAPADPFSPAAAPGEPGVMMRATALDILRARGLVFPEGSSASYIPATGELVVRNTLENLQKLEEFLESIRDLAPMNVACTFSIVQGDAEVMRQIETDTAAIADHTEVWRRIEAEAAQGRVKILRTTWIETRSGQRAKTWSGEERIHFAGMTVGSLQGAQKNTTGSSDAKSSSVTVEVSGGGAPPAFTPEFEVTMVGTTIEVDPIIGPDMRTVDLNFAIEHDTAPPTLHREVVPAAGDVLRVDAPGTDFHKAKLTTAVTLTNGMTRLLGLWKPETVPEGQAADVLQAAFVKVDLIKVEAKEK